MPLFGSQAGVAGRGAAAAAGRAGATATSPPSCTPSTVEVGERLAVLP